MLRYVRLHLASVLSPARRTITATPGISGLGAIKRGHRFQVTYERKPLYTYHGDTTPGAANGNDVQDFYVAQYGSPRPAGG